MSDLSHLDGKYFVDHTVYNCPFCKRNNVPFSVVGHMSFDWDEEKECYVYIVSCDPCSQKSAHLSYEYLLNGYNSFKAGVDLDAKFFHHQPSSLFTLDPRIPRVLRELLTEAQQSQNGSLLTGASACMRKAIYEFLILEGIPFYETVEMVDEKTGETKLEQRELNYTKRIKMLKDKNPEIDPTYFDELATIQEMTSDKIHEQSWENWDSPTISWLLSTLQAILREKYVLPDERIKRRENLLALKNAMFSKKKSVEATEAKAV